MEFQHKCTYIMTYDNPIPVSLYKFQYESRNYLDIGLRSLVWEIKLDELVTECVVTQTFTHAV